MRHLIIKIYSEKESSNNEEKFEYLMSRNFDYFPNSFRVGDYRIYEYLENSNISDEEKLYDIMDLISLLHTKTTRYKNIDIDDYKIIYEDLDKRYLIC